MPNVTACWKVTEESLVYPAHHQLEATTWLEFLNQEKI